MASAQPLTVCMAEDNPPLSYRLQGETHGVDLRVAQAIAAEMQRDLKVVLFESKYEADSSLSQEVNALLSSGVCDLASGFPLIAGDLGPPGRQTARVPDYPGAKPPPKRDWVPLGTLVATHAYHAIVLGMVVRDASREAMTLAEPGDARIGVVAGTMAGTAVTLYHNGKLRPQLVSLAQDQNPLEQLDAGRFDATLVSLDRLDAWKLAHPASTARRGAYVHPLRINIGFVARADAPDVLAAADRVIERARADGDLPRWTAAAGSTWTAPAEPEVSGPIGLPDLLREQ
jgi:ABC-type amino acid transport substrate-binding protein